VEAAPVEAAPVVETAPVAPPAEDPQPIPFMEEKPTAFPAEEAQPVSVRPEPAAPVTENPAPIVDAPKPVTENPAPIVDAPKPVTENPAPVEDAPKYVTEKPAPEVIAPQPTAVPPVPPMGYAPQQPVPPQNTPYAQQPGTAVPPQNGPYARQPGAPVPPYPGQQPPYGPNGPVPGGFVPPMPPQKPPKKGLSKGALIGIIAGAVALIALVLVLVLVVFAPKEPEPITINLNDYVTVTFEGYNYAGTVKDVNFDQDRLLADYGEAIQYTVAARKELRDTVRKIDAATFLEGNVLYKLYPSPKDYNFDLKNGDLLPIEWHDEGTEKPRWTNVTLEYSNFDVTVEGLMETALFDPFESLTVTFSGESGKGAVHVETPDDPSWFYMEVEYPREENLSNGDTVTVTVTQEDWERRSMAESDHKIPDPAKTSKTYTVEGLIVAEAFDPFENVHLVYDGFNGYGTAEVALNDDADPAVEDLSFNISPRFFLTNGDEITVDFYWNDYRRDEMVKTYGKEPSVLSKTYTVEGLDHYVMSPSEIPEEALQAASQIVIDSFTEDFENLNVQLDEPRLNMTVQLRETRLYTRESGDGNRLYLIYDVTLTGANGFSKQYLWTAYFANVMTKGGKVEATEDCNLAHRYTLSDSTIEVEYNNGPKTYTLSLYGCETLDDVYALVTNAHGEGYILAE